MRGCFFPVSMVLVAASVPAVLELAHAFGPPPDHPAAHAAPSFGTTRFFPEALLGPQFAVLSSSSAQPAVVVMRDGAHALRLSSATTAGDNAAPSGFLSSAAAPFAGDQTVDVFVADINREAANYEGMPVLVLAGGGYNASTDTGPRVQLWLKLHRTMNESFCSVEAFSNNASKTQAEPVRYTSSRTPPLTRPPARRTHFVRGCCWPLLAAAVQRCSAARRRA